MSTTDEETPLVDYFDVAPCELCGRKFARERLATHRRICATSMTAFRTSVRILDQAERPAGQAAAIGGDEIIQVDKSSQLVHCSTCGRSFASDRILTHRRACAQRLPGFRASVAALDACDTESAVVVALKKRADDAETELANVKTQLQEALRRAETAEVAAKSMEASYDVVAEALSDSQRREAEHRTRADAAEARLESAAAKVERAEAAAKSMEAAHDIVADALRDSERREMMLKEAAQRLQATSAD